MNMNNILFFDIETAANPDAEKYLPEFTAPANYKDPVKIAEYIEEKRKAAIESMALDPDYANIVALSYQIYPERKNIVTLLKDVTHTEYEIIQTFWTAFSYAMGRSCGYNIIAFDLPFIMRRSFALKIKPYFIPSLAKYQTNPTTDLMGILYQWGQAKGLKKVCDMYGIPNPLPELEGSQVATMDAETLQKYSANDVYLIVELYKRMQGIYIPESFEIDKKRSFRKPRKSKKEINVSTNELPDNSELPF